MEQEKVSVLVEENMKTIFAYALSRVSHKEDAEDLAGDIILSILSSAQKIRDDNAFFGYIWAIAANTYKKYLYKKSHLHYEELDEEAADEKDFVRDILQTEQFCTLRRELALLSREYRECTVAYYFEGLSCAETASKLHISLEMVKYYLFKTRKILKEGISMEREFGTKSYQPVKFNFFIIFEGAANMEYQRLFDRKLPGNILVSTYHTPMTIRQLAIELGVASVYLEDEIALLEQYGLLTALPGGKYQACLIMGVKWSGGVGEVFPNGCVTGWKKRGKFSAILWFPAGNTFYIWNRTRNASRYSVRPAGKLRRTFRKYYGSREFQRF